MSRWTKSEIASLKREAGKGATCRQIAVILGGRHTIPAVRHMGRLLGIRFYGRGSWSGGPLPSIGAIDQAKSSAAKASRDRMRGMGAPAVGYPLEFRAAALAEYLAGRGLRKTAQKYRVHPHSIMNWRADARAYAYADIIASELRETDQAAARERLKQIEESVAEVARLDRQIAEEMLARNREVMPLLSERERFMVEHYLGGESMEQVGLHFGITRERVRQILVSTKRKGIIFPEGKVRGEHGTYIPKFAHVRGKRMHPEGWKMNLSEAERERRREQGRRRMAMIHEKRRQAHASQA
jgi:DNA-binding CsgD family transcriptional regulator